MQLFRPDKRWLREEVWLHNRMQGYEGEYTREHFFSIKDETRGMWLNCKDRDLYLIQKKELPGDEACKSQE